MLSATQPIQGQLGAGTWFSDLFVAALQQRFTGGILVHAPAGDAAAFFRGGEVVHAAGVGFRTDFLGELLVGASLITQAQLDKALAEQEAHPSRPLLGTLLVAAGLDPAEIKRAIKEQNARRISLLFGVISGTYDAAPGENARIREIGVLTDASQLFWNSLTQNASDAELRHAIDAVLGKSVKLTHPNEPLPFTPTLEEIRRTLGLLDRVRKPDQLERAVGRRTARLTLRALTIFGRLETHPAAEGVPITGATLFKNISPFGMEPPPAQERAPDVKELKPQLKESLERARTPVPREPSRRTDPQLAAQIRQTHQDFKNKNHFEVLGATPTSDAAELRRLFTVLAKKWHPDAFPQQLTDDLSQGIREISARLNEAYQTLSSETSRAEYQKLLADSRFKGDAKKAEKVKDAETKFKMAQVLLKRHDYQKARELFIYATENDPDAGEYKAYLAWAMFSDASFDRKEVERRCPGLIKEALEKSGKNAQVNYFAGCIYKGLGKIADAQQQFELALVRDKKHADAQRELRLLDMRKKSEKEEGGLLSRLFKKS